MVIIYYLEARLLVTTQKLIWVRNLYNLWIEDNSFDAVNKFRYLGNVVGNEMTINTTIHERIQIGNRVAYTMPIADY